MGESERQAGLNAIRSIRQQIREKAPEARVFYSAEERKIRAMAIELNNILLASRSASSQLNALITQIDPFSDHFTQLEETIEQLDKAMESARKMLIALPDKYKSRLKEECAPCPSQPSN